MTQIQFDRSIKAIERAMQKHAEAEVRRLWREEHGVIYVRTYTVHAHFRPVRKRRRAS